jgi:predicted MFS family arabinose efflux permease
MSYFHQYPARNLPFARLVLVSMLLHINVSTTYALPFIVGSTMDGLGLNSVQAGFLATIEFVGMAATSLLLSAGSSAWNLKRRVLIAAVLVIVGELTSALVDNYEMLGAARILVGAGEGILLGLMNRLVAVSDKPERNFGYVLAASLGLQMLMVQIPPHVIHAWHHRGLFVTLAAIMLITLIPIRAVISETLEHEKRALRNTAGQSSWALMAAYFLVVTLLLSTIGGISSLTERIGKSVGLQATAIGFGFGAMDVVKLLGSAVAGWTAGRFGRALPFGTGMLLCGIAGFMISYATHPGAYFSGLGLWGFGFNFTVAYVMATAAALDASGRLAVGVAGYMSFAHGIGPSLYGYLVRGGTFQPAGLAALTECALGALLALLLFKTKETQEKSAVQSA